MRKTTLILLAGLVITLGIGIIRPGSDHSARFRFDGLDAFGMPGESVRFGTRLCRHNSLGMRRGVPGATVTYFVDGRTIGGALTNAKGYAPIAHTFDRAGQYTVEAMVERNGQELHTHSLVWVIDQREQILVVDVDQAVAAPPSIFGRIFRRFETFDPQASAARTLGHLDQTMHILYVTDRTDRHIARTRSWFERHGFPPAPIFFRSWEFYGGGVAAYKGFLMSDIVASWPDTTYAIADSTRDLNLFKSRGAHTMLLGEPSPNLTSSDQENSYASWIELGTALTGGS